MTFRPKSSKRKKGKTMKTLQTAPQTALDKDSAMRQNHSLTSITLALAGLIFVFGFIGCPNDAGGGGGSGGKTSVYVAGWESNGSNSVAKHWKNGMATALTDGSNDAIARSIYIVGLDVYVAGYESNGSKDVAKYWKNGTATALSDGSNDASAYSIYVVQE
jgi:hypothetical protein